MWIDAKQSLKVLAAMGILLLLCGVTMIFLCDPLKNSCPRWDVVVIACGLVTGAVAGRLKIAIVTTAVGVTVAALLLLSASLLLLGKVRAIDPGFAIQAYAVTVAFAGLVGAVGWLLGRLVGPRRRGVSAD